MGDIQGDIETVLGNIRYLKGGLGGYPIGYDTEVVIKDQLERRGHKGLDKKSVRIGFQIGYQEGFGEAGKHACDAFGILNKLLTWLLRV